jgi:hypothetical protein
MKEAKVMFITMPSEFDMDTVRNAFSDICSKLHCTVFFLPLGSRLLTKREVIKLIKELE